MFRGSMVALVTPMTFDGKVDEQSIDRLVEMHLQNKTDALVINASTAESVTLTEKEKEHILKRVLSLVKGKVPVITETGASGTTQTIQQTERAAALGVDACLVIAPGYNRPTQKGLYCHYETLAKTVPIPLILYNVPRRTGCDLLPETVAELALIPNIIGIKEASDSLERARVIIENLKDKINYYSGDDPIGYTTLKMGGKGVISVTANVVPRLMHEMCHKALEGDFAAAEKINNQIMPLHKALFVEPNPIPVKWALQQLGWIPEGIRLPLTPLLEQYQPTVLQALKDCGLLSENP